MAAILKICKLVPRGTFFFHGNIADSEKQCPNNAKNQFRI